MMSRRAASEPVVLVVEDDPGVLQLVRLILRQAGLTPLVVGHPLEALRTLQAQDVRVDLLLTDVRMPGLSGWELAQHARNARPGLPVIYMSATFAHDPPRLGEAEAMISKPFLPAHLLSVVRRALGSVSS